MLIEHLKASCHPLISDINTCLLLIDKAYHIAQKKKNQSDRPCWVVLLFTPQCFFITWNYQRGAWNWCLPVFQRQTHHLPPQWVPIAVRSACSLKPRSHKVTLSEAKPKICDTTHNYPPVHYRPFNYCIAVLSLLDNSFQTSTGLTLARKLQQRCFRQLHPDGLRTCGTRRIFRLVQLNVATPEGRSLSEKGEGSVPIQKMQNPWMQHLPRVGSPFDRLLPCSNMSG